MCFVPDESLRSWSNTVPNEIFLDFSSPGKIEDEFGHIHDRYERFGHSRQRSAPDEDPRNHFFSLQTREYCRYSSLSDFRLQYGGNCALVSLPKGILHVASSIDPMHKQSIPVVSDELVPTPEMVCKHQKHR